MILEIDDDYKDLIASQILLDTRKLTQKVLDDKNYWNEKDKEYDERLIAALDIVIKHYDCYACI